MARYSRCSYGQNHSDNSYITLKNVELIVDCVLSLLADHMQQHGSIRISLLYMC